MSILRLGYPIMDPFSLIHLVLRGISLAAYYDEMTAGGNLEAKSLDTLPGHGRVVRTFDVDLDEIVEPTLFAFDTFHIVPETLFYRTSSDEIVISAPRIDPKVVKTNAMLGELVYERIQHIVSNEEHQTNEFEAIPRHALFEYGGVMQGGGKVVLLAKVDQENNKRTKMWVRIGWNTDTKYGEAFCEIIARELHVK